MTKTEAMILLKENKNERGIANWQRLGEVDAELKSFGIGLTQLRKLSKKIGEIINSPNSYGRVITTMRRSLES